MRPQALGTAMARRTRVQYSANGPV